MQFSFDHNNINVANLEKSLAFYKEALGLAVSREVKAPDESFRLVFLSDASGAHALELTWLRDRTAPYNLGDNEFHMAVRTTDRAAAYDLHKKMGCICYENKEMDLYFISDPDGYWIEVLKPKAQVSAVNTLLRRHSVRTFTGEPVSSVHVEGLLRAAMQAPSAGNQQPWHFVVVRDRNILKSVPQVHPYAQMVPEADVAILVCAETASERYKGYWVQDCSAATENILIAAQAYGLGAVWLGIYPNEDRVAKMRELFGIKSDTVIPLALVPVGHPKHGDVATQDRFSDSRVHLNAWGKKAGGSY